MEYKQNESSDEINWTTAACFFIDKSAMQLKNFTFILGYPSRKTPLAKVINSEDKLTNNEELSSRLLLI